MSTLIETIADLTAQITQLTDQRTALLQDWAQEVSPWKVGEVGPVRGFSFNGRQCRVLSVTGGLSYHREPQVCVAAKVLKKDGSDSAHDVRWTWRPEDDQ